MDATPARTDAVQAPPDITAQHAVQGAAIANEILCATAAQPEPCAYTQSHLDWLSRECAKLLHREAEATAAAMRARRPRHPPRAPP